MHIIGTAGHVDHGKSSLVAALTGTNPDRWLEEQLRGMTLDLGFAHLRFESGIEAGIVDVPGHERFLHNMLAGAAGMELLLLIVDAVEGVMPQTIEHLQILRYLNVSHVIVVATKMDLIEPRSGGAACSRIREQLAGTIAQDAEIFAVSTVTGANLDVLKLAIEQRLRELAPRPVDAPPFLPVDRVFAMQGHGTIVTGTLMQGALAVGDHLKLAPQSKPVRVRGLQVFGGARERVEAGSRVAVNITGVQTDDVARGDVLAHQHATAAQSFSVEFTAIEGALSMLRRRNPVRAYVGSAELLGTLVFERVPNDDKPASATLHLRRETAVYPNAHFVLRRMSPKTLLGGGVIRTPGAGAPVPAGSGNILLAALQSSAEPLTPAALGARANVREDLAARAIDELVSDGQAVALSKPVAYVSREHYERIGQRVLEALSAEQLRVPWAMGMTSIALSRALGVDESQLVRFLHAFADEGTIVARHGYYSTADFTPKLTAEQRAFFEQAVPLDPISAHTPASLEEVVAAVKSSRITGIAQAFDTLLARGALVKVGADLYRGTQIAQIHRTVEAFLVREKQMTMAQFRDLLGTSRKFAVPLLEWFDARGITVRSGDYRMLRSKKG